MSPGFVAYMAEMAKGECLCAEIAEADRPCLTCEANAPVERWFTCPDCNGEAGGCLRCDGTGQLCSTCGEAEPACSCEDR